jgi:hypothetical protein
MNQYGKKSNSKKERYKEMGRIYNYEMSNGQNN